jgi:UPF0271 protein
MRRTAETAQKKGVAIGAHPSFPDRENFGRTNMQLSTSEVFDIVKAQVESMLLVCDSIGAKMNHVKPHGALYNMAAVDAALANAIAQAVFEADPELVLYGLSGSYLVSEAKNLGLAAASEVFADRTYTEKGMLTPRSLPNSMIENSQDAVNQVLHMVKTSSVVTTTGKRIAIDADTVCIHGDGPRAAEFARALRNELESEGIMVRSYRR